MTKGYLPVAIFQSEASCLLIHSFPCPIDPWTCFLHAWTCFFLQGSKKQQRRGRKNRGSSQARSCSWEHNPILSAQFETQQDPFKALHLLSSFQFTTLTILSLQVFEKKRAFGHRQLNHGKSRNKFCRHATNDKTTYIIASPRSSLALTCKMMQHVECQPSNSTAVTTWLELTNWSILCLMLVWLQSTLMCWLTEWCQWHKNIWICESPLLVGPPSFHVHWIQLPTVLNSRVNGLPCDIYCTTLMHLTIMFCQTVYPTPYAPPLAWGRLPRKDWSQVGQHFFEINE